jgi:hypothetical protein
MKRFVFSIAILLASVAADAQIYQWKDENGKTIISDKPPVGNVRTTRKAESETATGTTASPQKSLADKDLDFRKRQKDAQSSAEKSKAEQDQTAQREENCTNSQRHLRLLESGERIAMRDDNGERYFLEDTQRTQEIEKARQAVQSNCK